MEKAKADCLFEVCWEVCNKVGGIYTVVSSKASLMNLAYRNYLLVGPYFEKKAKADFEESDPGGEWKPIFAKLKKQGIVCHFGKWQVKGEPTVILLDFKGFINNKNQIKTDLWNNFKVDSIYSDWEFEEPIIWATAVAKLIEEYYNQNKEQKIVAHFHEWLSGAGLLCLKQNNVPVKTVFLTHATMLGRTMAASDRDLYGEIDKIEPLKEAYNYKIQDKHLIEKACAFNAHVFSTVSEITAFEAEKLLEKKPDLLLLNGLDIDKFPTFDELSVQHEQNKQIIKEFVKYYFYPYYYFDIEKTLLFFIVGRYEYKNKGIDIFINALKDLNEILKKEKSDKTIVVFFWIPRDVIRTKPELTQSKLRFDEIENFVERNITKILMKIVHNILVCETERTKCIRDLSKDLFDESFLADVKKLRLDFAQEGNPSVVTHQLIGESDDAIVKGLMESGLDNQADDRVKVIFYPVYLTGVDGLLNLSYYNGIIGCHLGLFPSYYEPWGYTPLESAALGVPSLTTDLGGFGRFLMEQNQSNQGIYILKRFQKSGQDVVKQFTKILYDFAKLDKASRVKQKMIAKDLAGLADWKNLIDNYIKAHNLALKR